MMADPIRQEGDLVLVYYQDQPALYARIESIDPDVKRDWFQVTLLFLTIPTQPVTWILRREYIDGGPFTMGGMPMKLEEVKKVKTRKAPSTPTTQEGVPSPEKKPKIIPFKKPSP
jgi:hypothetical protein